MKILIFLLCALLSSSCAPFRETLPEPAEKPVTGVYGQVVAAGRTVPGAWVYAYRSAAGNFRGPADFATRVEPGGYLLDLLPGRWYLVARWREQGGNEGPPRSGDAWAIYPQNPVVLSEGMAQRIDFKLQQVNQSLLLRGLSLDRGDTGFRGRLLDAQGQPVAGAFAMAYQGTDFRRMPDQTSAAVGADGTFILYVPQAGRYCLAARQRTRGQPIQGELYGQLGQAEAACREVSKGHIIDVGDIHLRPYLR